MKHSIRVKIVSICVGVLVITLSCLWGLNTFFLEDYYCAKKTEAFITSYDEIDDMLAKKINITQMDRTLQKIRDTNNIAFLSFDNECWKIIQFKTFTINTYILFYI